MTGILASPRNCCGGKGFYFPRAFVGTHHRKWWCVWCFGIWRGYYKWFWCFRFREPAVWFGGPGVFCFLPKIVVLAIGSRERCWFLCRGTRREWSSEVASTNQSKSLSFSSFLALHWRIGLGFALDTTWRDPLKGSISTFGDFPPEASFPLRWNPVFPGPFGFMAKDHSSLFGSPKVHLRRGVIGFCHSSSCPGKAVSSSWYLYPCCSHFPLGFKSAK